MSENISDYVVDETRFMLSDEEGRVNWFSEGSTLPDGIVFSEKLDETDVWQLYVSSDSRFYILAVKTYLSDKWCSSGLCKRSLFQRFSNGQEAYDLLFSPTSLCICNVSQLRAKGSLRKALAFYNAIRNSRNHDLDVNLRDGIFIELLSIVLPIYSDIPKVADKALFLNIFREDHEPENLSSPEEMSGGLAWFGLTQILKENNLPVIKKDLYLESGEVADDFFELEPNTTILGPVVIRDHYHIFDTDSSKFILLFDRIWGDALLSTSLVSQINISSISINGQMLYALTFPKNQALEPLNDRNYGLNENSIIKLDQALRRSRAACPKARLDNALYVEALGVCLPENFICDDNNNTLLMSKIAMSGPFAMAPCLDDIKDDAIAIASR